MERQTDRQTVGPSGKLKKAKKESLNDQNHHELKKAQKMHQLEI